MKYIFILTILSMMWWRKNLLFLIMNLELLIITLFYLMVNINISSLQTSIIMMFSMMVSGSCVALALMVALSQSYHTSSSAFLWSLTFGKINF